MPINDRREPQPRDLIDFIFTFTAWCGGAAWIGSLDRKHGLFFTPHVVSKAAVPEHKLFDDLSLARDTWPRGPIQEGEYSTLFVDIDQANLTPYSVCRMLDGLKPTAIVLTGDRRYGEGGRGAHAFWKLEKPISAAEWTIAQLALIGRLGSDPCTLSPWQPMRVGGFHAPGRVQTLLHLADYTTSLEHVRDFSVDHTYIYRGLAALQTAGGSGHNAQLAEHVLAVLGLGSFPHMPPGVSMHTFPASGFPVPPNGYPAP